MLSLYPIQVGVPLTPLSNVEGINMACLRRVGGMDTARVVINLKPEDANPYLAAGSPIVIRWFSEGQPDMFVGYVHSFKPMSEGYRQRTVVLAVSAAYPLYDQRHRVHQNIAIHNVAQTIADDYRFQLITEAHPLIQAQILQQEASDWTFLQRLADQWGYMFLFEGVTMIFRPLQRILEENYRRATLEHTESSLSDRPSNVRSFKPTFSAVGEVPAAESLGGGVDPITMKRIEWTEPGQGNIFQQFDSSQPVQGEMEAELTAVARDAKKRFPYSAKMVIQSPIGKKPSDIYQIAHEGQRMTWMVQSVKHVVTGEDYYGEMELGTDGKDYVTEASSRGLDVSSLIRTNQAVARSTPIVSSNEPYKAGAGASVLIAEQRWRAEVLSVSLSEGRIA